MTTAPFTVAIDGPAASGKGTIGRALAERFGFEHLDTGLLYRAVGARTLTGIPAITAAREFDPVWLADDGLRSPEVAQAASKAAAIPDVRAALLDFQRAFARRAGGAVLDGRDIGTVICPQAEVKLFVTATPQVRAQRRYLELAQKGHDVTRADVLADVIARDRRDSERSEAPLRPAEDALVLDTSHLTIDEALQAAVSAVEQRRG